MITKVEEEGQRKKELDEGGQKVETANDKIK